MSILMNDFNPFICHKKYNPACLISGAKRGAHSKLRTWPTWISSAMIMRRITKPPR